MAVSNYEISRDQARVLFLRYDQEKMIQKFSLKYDADYLYITFVGQAHRIERKTGKVEGTEDGFRTCWEAGYNESLTIYDVLCYSKDGCSLSGKFCSIGLLRGTAQFSNGGISLSQRTADRFQNHLAELKAACEQLGEPCKMSGDAAYLLHPFSFLPVILQFWDGDDEFPPTLKMMFDENIQDYMHYETIYYMTGHLLSRLTGLAFHEQQKGER